MEALTRSGKKIKGKLAQILVNRGRATALLPDEPVKKPAAKKKGTRKPAAKKKK